MKVRRLDAHRICTDCFAEDPDSVEITGIIDIRPSWGSSTGDRGFRLCEKHSRKLVREIEKELKNGSGSKKKEEQG